MRVLLVDDDAISREMMAALLEEITGHRVVECSSGLEARERYFLEPFSLVVTDIRMPGYNGLDLLREIKQSEHAEETDVILMTGFADVDTAVEALREGAADFLRKPVDLQELVEKIQALVHQRVLLERAPREVGGDAPGDEGVRSADPAAESPPEHGSEATLSDGTVVGLYSRPLHAALEAALRYHEDRTVPVLIEGETGTGKELFARVVHEGAEGTDAPFLSINCAALPDNLVESELFGYEGGAFTGARREGAVGKLEAAAGGTLLLDEIGEMPLTAQAKLLRALQERQIYPVGATNPRSIDVRIVASTNRDLSEEIRQDRFRRDLFHRIALGRIKLPPLRRQAAAIAPLAQKFLEEEAAERGRRFRMISRPAIQLLEQYRWPGNVRQLRNVIRHAVLLHDDLELKPEHLTHLMEREESGAPQAPPLVPGGFSLPEQGVNLPELQLELARMALERTGGNLSRAADLLGLTRSQMRTLAAKLPEE